MTKETIEILSERQKAASILGEVCFYQKRRSGYYEKIFTEPPRFNDE